MDQPTPDLLGFEHVPVPEPSLTSETKEDMEPVSHSQDSGSEEFEIEIKEPIVPEDVLDKEHQDKHPEPSKPADAEVLGSFGDHIRPPTYESSEKDPEPAWEEYVPDETMYTTTIDPKQTMPLGNLHPKVVELIYWRDVKKSGVLLGVLLTLLISVACFSVISVVSHLLLALLAITMSYRLYSNVLQALKKESIANPFSVYLDMDLAVTSATAQHVATPILKHLNGQLQHLRAVILVQDIIESLKHGVVFWILCYVGTTFNLLTLVTLAVVAVFTLPKVYEMYQGPIDEMYGQARAKMCAGLESVKAKLPFLNKAKNE